VGLRRSECVGLLGVRFVLRGTTEEEEEEEEEEVSIVVLALFLSAISVLCDT
jgi:hypothetical protein